MLQCTGSFFFQMNFIFQILQRKSMDTSSIGPIFNFIYLTLNIFVMMMIIFSKCREGWLNLVYVQVIALQLRTCLSLLDFEGKRFDDKMNTNFFIILMLWTITMFAVCLNFLIVRKLYIYANSFITSFVFVIGSSIMERKLKGTALEIFGQIFKDTAGSINFVVMLLATFYGSLLLQYIFTFGQNQVLKAWSAKNTAQKEFEFILSKLEEAIITKNAQDNSISYANSKGKFILKKISRNKDEPQPLK